MSVHQSTYDHSIYNRHPPSSNMTYNYNYTIRQFFTHTRQLNKLYTPQEACDEPLIPHFTQTAWTYFAVLSSSTLLPSNSDMIGSIERGLVNLSTQLETLIGCRKWEIGGLSWGLRTGHLVLILLFLWGGNYAASRKTTGNVYTHIQGRRAKSH